MAILRAKEIKKMSKEERDSRLKDLKLELIKSSVHSQKTKIKTKEIKRTIARLLTINKSEMALKKPVEEKLRKK